MLSCSVEFYFSHVCYSHSVLFVNSQMDIFKMNGGEEGEQSSSGSQHQSSETGSSMAQSADSLNVLAGLLRPLLGATPVTKHIPPKVTSVSHGHQLEFNCGIMNLLEESKSDKKKIEKALSELKDRNNMLVLAETQPDIFAISDRAKLFATMAGGGQVDPALLMAMAGPSTSKKRKHSPPPFQYRGSERAYTESRYQPRRAYNNHNASFDAGYGQPSRNAGNASFGGRSGPPQCYNCHQFGHIKPDCPALASFRPRFSEF